jgi:hypothetical protein
LTYYPPTHSRWDNATVDRFFDEILRLNYRCPDLDMDFPEQAARYFMDQNSGNGCVLPILDGRLEPDIKSQIPSRGIYDNRPGRFPRTNAWPNKLDTSETIDTTKKFLETQLNRVPDDPNDIFFISQWVNTGCIIIRSNAVDAMSPSLYYDGLLSMSPTRYPSVILMDYIGVWKEETDWANLQDDPKLFALGLNLYMASENCYTNAGTQPLLPGKHNLGTRRLAGSVRGPGWNGTSLFANGTVVDTYPPAEDTFPEEDLSMSCNVVNFSASNPASIHKAS